MSTSFSKVITLVLILSTCLVFEQASAQVVSEKEENIKESIKNFTNENGLDENTENAEAYSAEEAKKRTEESLNAVKESEKKSSSKKGKKKSKAERKREAKEKAEKEKYQPVLDASTEEETLKAYKKGNKTFQEVVDEDFLDGNTTSYENPEENYQLDSSLIRGEYSLLGLGEPIMPLLKTKDEKDDLKATLEVGKRNIKDFEEYIGYAKRTSNDIDSNNVAISLPAVKASETFDAIYKKANELMGNGFYAQGIPLMKRLLREDPENPGLHYWIGMAYTFAYSDNCKAIPYLQFAMLPRKNRYNENWDPRKDEDDLTAYFLLGHAYHMCGELLKAEESYLHYLETASPKKNPIYTRAEKQLKQIRSARKLQQTVNPFPIKNLGENINTFYKEYSPTVSNDGNTLYFSAAREKDSVTTDINFREGRYFSDIYKAERVAGMWQEATLLDTVVNSTYDEEMFALSADGKKIYYHNNNPIQATILVSDKAFDSWNTPVVIFPNTNTSTWANTFSISKDGRTLVFAAKGADSYGGLDLYISYRKMGTRWTKPINMGPSVNTKDDEVTPYLHPDGKVLYFSSNSEKSSGGFDVFKSNINGRESFSEAENIGFPMNSLMDDLYYTVSTNGRYGFVCRPGEFGDLDIFEIDFFGKNYNNENLGKRKVVNNPNAKQLWVTNLATKKVEIYEPQESGDFNVLFEPCIHYEVSLKLRGKTESRETIISPCEGQGNKQILVDPMEDLGSINMLLKKSKAKTNTPRETSLLQDETLEWQVLVDGQPYDFPGFEVNLTDELGNKIKTKYLQEQGYFEFIGDLNQDQFSFSVQTKSLNVCSRLEITLVRGRQQRIQEFTFQPKCFKK